MLKKFFKCPLLRDFSEVIDVIFGSGVVRWAHYIKDMNAKTYIPGHGKPQDLGKSYEAYLNYLETLKEKVKVAYDDGVESYEIKNSIINDFNDYKSWVGFEDYFGKHIGNIYRELEAKNL